MAQEGKKEVRKKYGNMEDKTQDDVEDKAQDDVEEKIQDHVEDQTHDDEEDKTHDYVEDKTQGYVNETYDYLDDDTFYPVDIWNCLKSSKYQFYTIYIGISLPTQVVVFQIKKCNFLFLNSYIFHSPIQS